MTHVDQKHHVTRVTLDRLTKVTAITTIFNALPVSRVLLYLVTHSTIVASSHRLRDAA